MKFTEFFSDKTRGDKFLVALTNRLWNEEHRDGATFSTEIFPAYVCLYCEVGGETWQRTEIFKSGYIELYGSNAGVDAVALVEFFWNNDVQFER